MFLPGKFHGQRSLEGYSPCCCCPVLSGVQLIVTPWTAAHQASLSFTISQDIGRVFPRKLEVSSEEARGCHNTSSDLPTRAPNPGLAVKLSFSLLPLCPRQSESGAALSCPTLVTPWTAAHQAPLPRDFPGKSTGVGCHFLVKIFPTQGLNLRLPHCRQTLYHLSNKLCCRLTFHLEKEVAPTPVFSPEESQGQRSLLGFRLWGCTESDTTDAT